MDMITTADLRDFGWTTYSNAPLFVRALQALRPYICPIETLLDHIPPNSNVLDIGCGTGGLLLQVEAFRGLESGTGIDTAEASIRVANKVNRNADVSFLCLDQTDRWPTGPFDVVSVIDVLHHVPSSAQDSFLRACLERVRPGGLLVYKDMAEKPVVLALCNKLHDLVMARQWIHYYPLHRATTVITCSDFEVTTTASLRRFVYQHELVVARRAD